MIRGDKAESGAVPVDDVRRHLTKILASPTFADTERLRTLLRWLVSETLEGRDETLKEAVVGVAVFHRQPGWDQQNDAIVRVQVRNLRLCLARYYQREGCEDRVKILIPKGGYHPVFERQPSPGLTQRLPRWALWSAAAALSAMLAVVSWVWLHRALRPRWPVAVSTFVNLTSDPRQNLVAAGLTQEVSAQLALDSEIGLKVLPPASPGAQPPACRGTESYWLSGSLAEARSGQPGLNLVTVRLVACHGGRELWTKRYERPSPELEFLSRLIALEVQRSLR
jgi:adenylate cyclase